MNWKLLGIPNMALILQDMIYISNVSGELVWAAISSKIKEQNKNPLNVPTVKKKNLFKQRKNKYLQYTNKKKRKSDRLWCRLRQDWVNTFPGFPAFFFNCYLLWVEWN